MFDKDGRMSEPTLERFVGVDVAKDWLDLCADPCMRKLLTVMNIVLKTSRAWRESSPLQA